jgi:hypothetical protein
MPPLSAADADSLAQSFRDMAQTMSDFLHAQWANLDPNDRQQVHDNIFDLLLRSDDLEALAGILDLDSAATSVAQLTAATQQASQFLEKVADLKKAVGLVAAGLGLATAIVAKDPKAIMASLKTFQGLLKPSP